MPKIKWVREAGNQNRFGIRGDLVLYSTRWNTVTDEYELYMHHPGTSERSAPAVQVGGDVHLEKVKEAAEAHFELTMKRLGLKDADG